MSPSQPESVHAPARAGRAARSAASRVAAREGACARGAGGRLFGTAGAEGGAARTQHGEAVDLAASRDGLVEPALEEDDLTVRDEPGGGV